MLSTQFSTLWRVQRLFLAACLPILFTACESENSSLLNLEALLPSAASISTNLDPVDTEEIVNTPPVGESNSGITPELEVLTRGPIRFESSFDGSADPIPDVFQFTTADYEFSEITNSGVLGSITDTTISICAFIPATTTYLCFRVFDGGESGRVWHLFSMQTDTVGSGVFEFCNENISDEVCRDELFDNPDGTDTVAITPLNASVSLPNASPYFAYSEQGTVNRQSNSVVVDERHINTMKALVTAAEQLIED